MKKSTHHLPWAVAAACLASVQAHASVPIAPPMLSFTEVVDSSFGASAITSTSSSGQQTGGATQTWIVNGADTYHNVITPSTSTVQGSVDVYKDAHSSTYTQVDSYQYDSASYRVSVNTPVQSAGQYISLTGTVTTTAETDVSFYLMSAGTFSSLSAGSFGAIAPALPLLGFGPSGTSGLTTTATTSAATGMFSENAGAIIHLNAGGSYSFNAFVYSPSAAVSLSSFTLNITGGAYNSVSNTSQVINPVVSTLVSSVALPLAAAVPEPESYALLMAGLGMIGVMARRRMGRSHNV